MVKSPTAADVSPDRDDAFQSEQTSQPMELAASQDRERIAQRAYERYETRGREDGRDLEDWLEAERELQQGTSRSATAGDGDRRDDTGDAA